MEIKPKKCDRNSNRQQEVRYARRTVETVNHSGEKEYALDKNKRAEMIQYHKTKYVVEAIMKSGLRESLRKAAG